MNWKNKATLGVSVKNRNDYADYDYLDKLSPKDLTWLKGFHREYVNADFNHKHKKHYKTVEDKREIYKLNNIRNRDLYNVRKWTNELWLNAHMDGHEGIMKPVELLSELLLSLEAKQVKKIIKQFEKKIDKKRKV